LCTFDAVQRDGKKFSPRAANPSKSADPILHREPTLLKNRSNATGDFKNLKSAGVPLLGPNLSFKVGSGSGSNTGSWSYLLKKITPC
jgi:hypothetical protein